MWAKSMVLQNKRMLSAFLQSTARQKKHKSNRGMMLPPVVAVPTKPQYQKNMKNLSMVKAQPSIMFEHNTTLYIRCHIADIFLERLHMWGYPVVCIVSLWWFDLMARFIQRNFRACDQLL